MLQNELMAFQGLFIGVLCGGLFGWFIATTIFKLYRAEPGDLASKPEEGKPGFGALSFWITFGAFIGALVSGFFAFQGL